MQDFSFEICRKSISIPRYEENVTEWCNSHFAVGTTKGIHFYEFSHNLDNIDKHLDFVETFVDNTTSSPSKEQLNCEFVRSGLSSKEIPEMITDTALWGHSKDLCQNLTTVISFEFSPKDLVRDKYCALAVLNNIGSVELFNLTRLEWESVLNVSDCINDQFKENLKTPKSFNDLKKTAYSLTTTAICWAPYIKNGFTYFVTSQKSGSLCFWLIQNEQDDITAKYCGKIELIFNEIAHLKWISKSENHFILVCSNVVGQVMALECQINKDKVILMKSHMLWEHQDRMIAKFTEYYIDKNKILLLYNKHRHIVGQLLDGSCRVISQSVDNINDHRITSVAKNGAQFYVSTVNFKLYRINYSLDNNVLKITFDLIDIPDLKDISPTMELYNITFSVNGVICGLSGLDRKVMHKKPPMLKETIFIQTVPDRVVLDILINNPTKQLTDYWDCIELLRYKIVKLKTLPEIDYKVLLSEGQTDLYKLKIYFIILKIYRTLVNNIKIADGGLPENSLESIKDKILVLNANKNIKTIYNKHHKKKSLTNFEMETYAGSKSYLNYYCKKYETQMADVCSPELLDLEVNESKYICQCCDEEILNFNCSNGHLNMFCSLTFTPIENLEYLRCKYCNILGRLELLPEKPLCVFCDSYLDNYDFCV